MTPNPTGSLLPIAEVIPESTIVVFSPHFDDLLFMLGSYVLALNNTQQLNNKQFHIIVLFSRSNYQAGSGNANFDTRVERIKLATGHRVIEDQDCINELLGRYQYTYELAGEDECFVRGKQFADSDMEFPHGTYEDFDAQDHVIFARMQQRIRRWADQEDTALVFPLAFKEHIDHFIVREAAITVAQERPRPTGATFYFQEDKPYGGLATPEELARTEAFITEHQVTSRCYAADPEAVIRLAFKHYVSQVEEVYKTGIRQRTVYWQEKLQIDQPADRICVYHPRARPVET